MSGNAFARFGTHNAVLPKEGPMVFGFNLDFTTATGNVNQVVDLQLQVQQGFVSFVQGFYIDNVANTNFVDVVCSGTNQRIRIPAGKQGYMPMFITDEPVLTITTPALAAGLIVPIFVTNVPTDCAIW